MKYPLPLVRLEVAHKTGVWVGDPTSVVHVLASDQNYFRNLEPIGDGFSDKERKLIPTLSLISNEEAVVYRANEYEIALTPDELDRFLRKDLHPKEFKVLFEVFGDIFELHDDFYDPDTGESMQPFTF